MRYLAGSVRGRIACEDSKVGFAEKFHGHAAASTGANHDRVEKSRGICRSPHSRFSMLLWNDRRIAEMRVFAIVGMRAGWHFGPGGAKPDS
jgi:hypothetical protein